MKISTAFTGRTAAALAVAFTLGAFGSASRAADLSIEPSVATFTPTEDFREGWATMADGLSTLFRGLTYSTAGLSAPVTGVTIQGEGPGPVRIALGDGFAGQYDSPSFSLLASDLAFDVGAKALTLDLRVRLYNTCDSSGGNVCAAWASRDVDLQDLAVLKADAITGSIDGNMSLDQAVALQTLRPQSLTLSADLYLDFGVFDQVLPLIVAGYEPVGSAIPGVKLGQLNISAVPELSSGSMLCLGLAGIAAMARRRRPA